MYDATYLALAVFEIEYAGLCRFATGVLGKGAKMSVLIIDY